MSLLLIRMPHFLRKKVAGVIECCFGIRILHPSSKELLQIIEMIVGLENTHKLLVPAQDEKESCHFLPRPDPLRKPIMQAKLKTMSTP